MYSLDELFRGSTHKASVFMPETVKWLENRIAMKQSRGGEVPYVKCIIRNKEVRLTPEEAVRQMYVYELIHKEGYPAEQIQLEYPVHFGREVKRADIVIFEKKHPDSEYIIVEVKKPKLLEGKAQLKSYCNATGALIGVWTNGEITECYHRKDPNYFEKVDHLPKAYETLKDVIGKRKTTADLERDNRLKDGKITLNLTPVGYKGIMKSESPAAIMQKLEEAGGYLPYGDHSDPEEIRREFGMSKKTFKKILGTLFREGRIILSDDGFRKN